MLCAPHVSNKYWMLSWAAQRTSHPRLATHFSVAAVAASASLLYHAHTLDVFFFCFTLTIMVSMSLV